MWTTCAAGHPHWGRYGAAGLLVVDAGRVLLQRRSARVHQGGTWSVPGGAREPWETAWEAALREAGEETGIRPDDVVQLAEHVAECFGWYYTTEVAGPVRSLSVVGNFESDGHRWVPLEEVPALPLHPAFARAWPALTQAAQLHP